MTKIEDRVSTLETGSVEIREHVAGMQGTLKTTLTVVVVILTFVLGSVPFIAGIYSRIGRIEAMVESAIQLPASIEVVIEE